MASKIPGILAALALSGAAQAQAVKPVPQPPPAGIPAAQSGAPPNATTNPSEALLGVNNLLVLDRANGQVSVNAGSVPPYRSFYARLSTADMTVNGEHIGHAAIEARTEMTGQGTAAVNPDGVYGTLWYRPTSADANFTGDGAAVRGNAYTIKTPHAANVINLIGVYARARQEGLGTVTNAVAFFADGAQQGAGSGSMTNAYAYYTVAQTIAKNNYGLFFANDPNRGSIASAASTPISIAPGGTKLVSFQTSGSVVQAAPSAASVVYEVQNTSMGPRAAAVLEVSTGTKNGAAQLSAQDNNGSPYFLGALGSSMSSWVWNGPFTAWQDNSGVQYARVSKAGVDVAGYVKAKVSAVSGLPTCNASLEGAMQGVNDARSATFHAPVAGGGSNHVLAYCTGSGWVIGG